TVTPRTFTAASSEKSAASSSARPGPAPAAGQTTPTDPANALATDATANDAMSQNRTPARKPTNGPNATSTYAYRPPVSETRLPADAKHNTISAISIAQTTYATGAAGPRRSATTAGSTKMPAPIVTLTMLAVSRRTPIARTSAASASRSGSWTRVTVAHCTSALLRGTALASTPRDVGVA